MMPPSCKTLLAAATLLLASCTLLQPAQRVSVYAPALLPVQRESAPPPARSWRLALEEPQAIAPFDGTRMVVAPVAGELQFYKGARWRDTAPRLLQDLLLQAFDRAAPQLNAVRAAGAGRADFVLRSDLRALTAEYRGAAVPTVDVQLAVQLLRRADGNVVATRRFSVETACAGTQLVPVFAAFQDALNRLARDVVDWTAAAAEAEQDP